MKSSNVEFTPAFQSNMSLPRSARPCRPAVSCTREYKAGLFSTANCLAAVGITYWGIFWAANGLDKFLNRTDFGPFVWYGKDRMAQFTDYFTKLGLPSDFVLPVLRFAGFWELVVALPFLGVLILLCSNSCRSMRNTMVTTGFVLSGLTLIAFSGFDVIAGDRAELREHALYLALLVVCCIMIRSTGPFGANRTEMGRNDG